MKVARLVVFLGALCLLAGCGVASSNPPAPEAHEIAIDRAGAGAVRLTAEEYRFGISKVTVRAGQVDFVLANQGKWTHEAVVVPVEGTRYGQPVAQVGSVPSGESGATRVTLAPGRYVIVCLLAASRDGDVVSHWSQGMEAELEVSPS